MTHLPYGRMPPMTPAAQKNSADIGATLTGRADAPEDWPLSERCITFGIPNTLAGYNKDYQICSPKTRSRLTASGFRPHPRHPDGRHATHAERRRLRWRISRGHWEGDTLVIDTTNFAPGAGIRGADDNLHLIQRFTRVSPTRIKSASSPSDHPTVDASVDRDYRCRSSRIRFTNTPATRATTRCPAAAAHGSGKGGKTSTSSRQQ